jgi:hypothetical protein
MFVVYDHTGTILATIQGPGPEYGPDILDREGKRWLFLDGVTSLDPTCHYVDTARKAVIRKTPP